MAPRSHILQRNSGRQKRAYAESKDLMKTIRSRLAARAAVLGILALIAAIARGFASPGPQPSPPAQAQSQPDHRPLPDIPTLLRDSSKNQRALEEIRKLYTCHLSEEDDKRDSHGAVKSRTVKDYDVFYIDDDEVLHMTAKEGKPLAGQEKKKEDARFSKEFDKLKRKQAELANDPKKKAKQEEEEDAEISDFLRAEKFTNPRRVSLDGRDVIAFDFAGNPQYRPRKSIERIIQKLVGEMWVDEQAEEIVRLEAHFVQSVKVGGGLLGSLSKGSNLIFEQKQINDEAWLPSYVEIHFSGRVTFVKLKGDTIDRYSDYKKFRVATTLSAAGSN
jgi:hypothetical protein